MRAMILAAGRGERMRPLTDHTPKPLLKVGGKPLIVWHLERLANAGFKDVVINHAHLGQQIEDALGDGKQWGLHIQYSPEKVALETAGGIANALPLLGEQPFLVVNGDVFTDINFADVASHMQLGNPLSSLSRMRERAEGEGACIKLNANTLRPFDKLTAQGERDEEATVKNTTVRPSHLSSQFTGLENWGRPLRSELVEGHAQPRYTLAHLILINNPPQHAAGDFAIENGLLKNAGEPMLTFSGIGVYHPDLFAEIPRGTPAKLAPLLRQAIAQSRATAQHYQGVWHDIGTPERLAQLDAALTNH